MRGKYCIGKCIALFLRTGGSTIFKKTKNWPTFTGNIFTIPIFQPIFDISFRFRAIFYLYRDFCKHQAIQDAATDKLCILDEGLLQKSFLIHEDVKIIQDLLDEYLALLPLPRAIFWVDIANVEEIVKRIKNRQKIIASHIGEDDKGLFELSMRWRRLIELIAEKLQRYEVKVFELDGEMTLDENVEVIQKSIMSCADDDRM